MIKAGITCSNGVATATISAFTDGFIEVVILSKARNTRSQVTDFDLLLDVNQGEYINFQTENETSSQVQTLCILLIETNLWVPSGPWVAFNHPETKMIN